MLFSGIIQSNLQQQLRVFFWQEFCNSAAKFLMCHRFISVVNTDVYWKIMLHIRISQAPALSQRCMSLAESVPENTPSKNVWEHFSQAWILPQKDQSCYKCELTHLCLRRRFAQRISVTAHFTPLSAHGNDSLHIHFGHLQTSLCGTYVEQWLLLWSRYVTSKCNHQIVQYLFRRN